MTRKRKATKREACGYPSFNGRVCRYCLKFYGPPAENAIAAADLQRRLDAADRAEGLVGVMKVIGELCDVIVPDWPGVSLPRLLHSTGSAVAIAAADQEPRELKQGELFE